MFRLASSILFLTIIVSCNKPPAFSEKEKKLVVDSVSRVLHSYYEDISKNGLMAEFNYLDSTADFFWVPPGYSQAISFDSTARFIKRNATIVKTIRINWEYLRVIPLSRELASYTGRLHSASTDTTGNKSNFSLIETGIVIKRKTGWKLLHGQTAIVETK